MVDASLRDVSFDADENIMGTLNVLEAARKGGVKRIIFASTAAAYGDVTEKDLPIQEDHPLKPTSFYGLSKITVEKYLALYAKLFGLEYVICRFANVYGERQGDKGEGGVVSIFAKRITQNLPITIYGNGEQTRDFVYAGDIASGIYAALKTTYANEIYNLSTQTEVSINDLVALFNNISSKKLKPTYTEVREGDIFRSTLSNAKAKEKLQWEPQMQLEKGLRRTYDYFMRIK
jgi:UDP-glucose 4-epimerase